MTVASGATYRSLIHADEREHRSSKNRTGETSFVTARIRVGTSSVGPSTQPRVSFAVERDRT